MPRSTTGACTKVAGLLSCLLTRTGFLSFFCFLGYIYHAQLQAPGNKEQSELAFIVVGVRVLTASKRGFDSNFLLSFLLAFLYFFLSFLYFWGIYTTQTAGA